MAFFVLRIFSVLVFGAIYGDGPIPPPLDLMMKYFGLKMYTGIEHARPLLLTYVPPTVQVDDDVPVPYPIPEWFTMGENPVLGYLILGLTFWAVLYHYDWIDSLCNGAASLVIEGDAEYKPEVEDDPMEVIVIYPFLDDETPCEEETGTRVLPAPLEDPPLTQSKDEGEKPIPASGPPHTPKQKKVLLIRNNNIPYPCPLPTQPEEPPRQKKITFIGHSYVKELAKKNFELVLSSKMITPEYIGVPGGTFRTYLNNPHYFQTLRNTQPDIVVAVMGGNDIKTETSLKKNLRECSEFYRILRDTVPSAYIIASQVETRFYRPNNRHGCPTHHRFDQLRRQFNRFLERLTSHDLILEIEGHLDERKDYRDGVHLSHTGFMKYLDIIQMTVSLAEDRSQTHRNNGARKEPASHQERTPSATSYRQEGSGVPVKKDPAPDRKEGTPPFWKRRPVAADFF